MSIRKLADIPDVVLTSATDNQVLTFDGTDWVNEDAGGGGAGFTEVLIKLTDEVITSDSTFTDDNTLTFEATANTSFYIFVDIRYSSNSTPDFKYKWNTPVNHEAFGYNVGGNWMDATELEASRTNSINFSGSGTGNPKILTDSIRVDITTAGTVALQWAQEVSDASDTTVFAGSMIAIRKAA